MLPAAAQTHQFNYRIFRPITRALSIQKGSEIVKMNMCSIR